MSTLRRIRDVLLLVLTVVTFAVLGFSVFDGWGGLLPQEVSPTPVKLMGVEPSGDLEDVPPVLAIVFTPEVHYWEDEIIAWAQEHDLDHNLVATVMQIESCGDPEAISPSGAMGLFQVMPYHFAEGEDPFDPDTNALRGLTYLTTNLEEVNGHVGLALAGYNGGHLALWGDWETWSTETRSYFRWGSGIYREAAAGWESSPTLQAWLRAGGTSLCGQAALRQTLAESAQMTLATDQ